MKKNIIILLAIAIIILQIINMKILQAHTDIDFLQKDLSNNLNTGILDNVKSFQVGYGGKNMRVDSQGLWLGADKFADAPFSVDMEGNMKATSGVFSGTVSAATITGSTITGGAIIGSSIETSNNADKIILNNTGMKVYKSNDLRIHIFEDLIKFFASSGQSSGITATGTFVLSPQGQLHLYGSPIVLNSDTLIYNKDITIQNGSLEFNSNGLIKLPVMTDSSQAGTAEPEASMYYNSNTNRIHVKTGNGWRQLADTTDLP